MKIIALILVAVALAGCQMHIKVPPGSLTSWTHTDNYGPWQDQIAVTQAEKLQDGTFVMGHYDGHANFLGYGVHDIIENLHVDGKGQPVAAPPVPVSAPPAPTPPAPAPTS